MLPLFIEILILIGLAGNVPTKNKSNKALGRWVSTQRSNYKKFKKSGSIAQSRMDREEMEKRIRKLNGISFTWSLLPGGMKSEEEGNSSSKSSLATGRKAESGHDDGKEDHRTNERGTGGGEGKNKKKNESSG